MPAYDAKATFQQLLPHGKAFKTSVRTSDLRAIREKIMEKMSESIIASVTIVKRPLKD